MPAETIAGQPSVKRFHSPQSLIARFVAARTLRSASFLALIFGLYVASKAIGYAQTYPTAHERATIAASFANNVGLKMLFGPPNHLETITGYVIWNTLPMMAMIGAVWGYLRAVRTFRGEEDAGRWELLLGGQTTRRRAAANALLGLGASLAVLFVVITIAFSLIGLRHDVHFGVRAAAFFALAAASSVAMFFAVGALASQLMPTRSRASSLATAVFGLSFLIRAAADTANIHWLLWLSPLGWIEQTQPLYHSQAWWLLPIGLFVTVLSLAAVTLAGQRDLGASTFGDRDSARPRTLLLNSSLTLAVRLTRSVTIAWLAAITALTAFFGLLTHTAAQAFGDSASLQRELGRLAQSTSHYQGAKIFLGIVFFLAMTMVMCYAASAVNAMREDEAQGFLDNLLVRPVSRMRWLGQRVLLASIIVAVSALLIGAAAWLGTLRQANGISYHELLLAGLNVAAPAYLVLGIAVFALGVMPRFTALVAYGAVAWSFALQMLASGLHLNHWLLDTSIFYHTALAPAVSPRWSANLVLIALGVALVLAGALRFNRRDIANE